MSETAKQEKNYANTAIECLDDIPPDAVDIDGVLEDLAVWGEQDTADCSVARLLGGRAVDRCVKCEFRPGRDFERSSPVLSQESAPMFVDEFRRAVRDDSTDSNAEKLMRTPIAADAFRMTLAYDKNALARIARTMPAIARYRSDINSLNQHGKLYESEVHKLHTERELAVSLLTVPPIMQRNYNHDKMGEGGRETEEMTELMNHLYRYVIARPDEKLTAASLTELLDGFFSGTPTQIRDQAAGIVRGTVAEVAVGKALDDICRHGTVKEDRQGRDFVWLGDDSKYIDVKCKRRRRGADGALIPVTEVYYDKRTHHLYVPPEMIDWSEMTLAKGAVEEVRRVVGVSRR